jgi:ArsR family transcriptional regulator
MTEAEARAMADRLAALADPSRIRLLDLLARRDGQVCVCELVPAMGLSQPTVSHHLRILRAAGLVDYEKRGVWAHYFVRRDALRELGRAAAALADAGFVDCAAEAPPGGDGGRKP